ADTVSSSRSATEAMSTSSTRSSGSAGICSSPWKDSPLRGQVSFWPHPNAVSFRRAPPPKTIATRRGPSNAVPLTRCSPPQDLHWIGTLEFKLRLAAIELIAQGNVVQGAGGLLQAMVAAQPGRLP